MSFTLSYLYLHPGQFNAFPISSRGLDGTGQLIQIADTGLDMNHCLFRDSRGNVAFTTYTTGLSRKKMVQFVVRGYKSDGPEEGDAMATDDNGQRGQSGKFAWQGW